MRVPSESKNCVEMQVGNTVYRAKNGYFNVPEKVGRAYLKDIGEPVPPVGGYARKGHGYHCSRCGFDGWFKKCGKCGYGRCRRVKS